MVLVTRLDDSILYVNPHQIEFMESTPDLVISMLSGRKIIVKEKFDIILSRIIDYRTRTVDESSVSKPSFYGNED